jgi:DNA (cytosine-5)-methyltransferase 1
MSKEFIVVDMFCGAGGASEGMRQALEELGINARMYAINHWPIAVSTHAKNIPQAEHICEPVEKIDPLKLFPKGKIDLLWASPECTHFSIARGKKPSSDQKRASPWRIIEWMEKLEVKHLIMENVKEFQDWGPLDNEGHPIQSKKGTIFRAFLHVMRSMGYFVDWQILNCANYGDPTARRRFFLQAVKGKSKIKWPTPTHMESAYNIFGLPKWRPAREIIDWSIIGESIFSRKKPLVEATIKRIEHGIRRFWGPYAEPFLISLYGTGMSRSLDRPLPTITTSGKHSALIEPYLINNYGQSLSMDINEPIPTITGSQHTGIVEPFLSCYHGGKDTARRAYRLSNPIPTLDKCLFDIRYRMLAPHELSAAQGFPQKYVFEGTKTDVVKQIGNAVPVNTARNLSKAAIVQYLGESA